MLNADQCYKIFQQSIDDYHKTDSVDAAIANPFPKGSFEHLLYAKNWIDTVQWHLEDIIRVPSIDPAEGIAIKRRIDKSNQDRTDSVEQIDDHFLKEFVEITPKESARINSETPAWLLDRMSILMLKLFHMKEQTERTDTDDKHLVGVKNKLSILKEQRDDMRQAFDELLHDIKTGDRRFKVYRQMKMYNDASLNPMLYSQKK